MTELNDLFRDLDKASDKVPSTLDLANVAPHIISTENPNNASVEPEAVDITKYLRRLDDVTDDVLKACKADRAETQDLINLLRDQVENAIGTGSKLSTGIIESLVKAIEVKSNINTTAVKMIEANAKTLAATKSSINIQQNTVSAGIDSNMLERILSQPLGENEDI